VSGEKFNKPDYNWSLDFPETGTFTRVSYVSTEARGKIMYSENVLVTRRTSYHPDDVWAVFLLQLSCALFKISKFGRRRIFVLGFAQSTFAVFCAL
jgi:hypothetical protein